MKTNRPGDEESVPQRAAAAPKHAFEHAVSDSLPSFTDLRDHAEEPLSKRLRSAGNVALRNETQSK